MLLVTGSQADRRDRNKITMLKLSDVHKTKGNQEGKNVSFAMEYNKNTNTLHSTVSHD